MHTYISKNLSLILTIPIILLVVLSVPSITLAAHGEGPTTPSGLPSSGISGAKVCNGNDGRAFRDRGSTRGTSNDGAGGGGGLYVPVKDFEAEDILESISNNIIAIERDTDLIEGDTQAIRYYLRMLCEKEFVHDHTIQHKWRVVISKFMKESMDWITNAYESNPIFVTNPYVYYRNVEIGIANTLIEEIQQHIKDGDVDPISGLLAMRSILSTFVDKLFGEYVEDWTKYDPVNKAIFEDREQFTWASFIGGTLQPINNVYEFEQLAMAELDLRKIQARGIEEQKLAWGRGFFPYEICGQKVFSEKPIDVRTCITLTPGSIQQDMASAILSSALRQMENADEYEEWISGRAFWAMNSVFNKYGILAEEPALKAAGTIEDVIWPQNAEDQLKTAEKVEKEFIELAKKKGYIANTEKSAIFILDLPTLEDLIKAVGDTPDLPGA